MGRIPQSVFLLSVHYFTIVHILDEEFGGLFNRFKVVIEHCNLKSLFNRPSFLSVVFLLVPITSFLGGVIPDGNRAASSLRT